MFRVAYELLNHNLKLYYKKIITKYKKTENYPFYSYTN